MLRAMLLALIALFAPSTSAVEPARAALIARSVYAAEDAAAKHDWTTVKSVLEPVVDDATINGRMWQLLGRAYFATGDWTRARRVYERVFELRQGTVSSAAYSIAVCSARLGDNAGAMAWLERAVATSLRSMDDARSEEAFKPLRSDKRFRQLFSVVDPKSLSRVQGWSLDLDVLSREIKRKAFHPFVTRRRDRVEWGAQLTEKQFDRAVADLKSRVGRLSDQRMGLEIQRLLRRVGDGHTASFADEGPTALRWTLPMLTFDSKKASMSSRPSRRTTASSDGSSRTSTASRSRRFAATSMTSSAATTRSGRDRCCRTCCGIRRCCTRSASRKTRKRRRLRSSTAAVTSSGCR